MTQDEIIRMARDAGWNDLLPEAMKQVLERFADLVAEATKEKAAKVCEEEMIGFASDDEQLIRIAAAIRSMK